MKVHIVAFPIIFIVFCVFMVILQYRYPENFVIDKNLEKVEQGKMSKVTYQGHTYVVWSINMGGGVVHDPDCKCLKIKD